MTYEYKVIPAPTQGRKAKGVKTTPDRFALALTETLNDMSEDGWQYVRAETLPCDERRGLTGTQTTFQNMLIFRRAIDVAEDEMESLASVAAAPAPLALENATTLRVHEEADPVSADLGDTLRATREPEGSTARRLGPANGDAD